MARFESKRLSKSIVRHLVPVGFVTVSILSLAAIAAGGGEVIVRRGTPDSPIDWTDTDDIAGEELDAVRELVHQVSGYDSPLMTGTRGRLEVRTSFGDELRPTSVLRIHIPDFVVPHPSGGIPARVDLSLVFDEQRERAILAYTKSRDEWVLPQDGVPVQDMESAAARLVSGIRPLRDNESVRLNVSEALSAVWREYGVNPSTAGQIIIRPRMVTSNWPPVSKRYAPELDRTHTQPYWVVEVMGYLAHVRPDNWPQYSSRRLLLISDDNTKVNMEPVIP